MIISLNSWQRYIKKLDAINSKAAEKMFEWVEAHGLDDRNALIDYAYGLTTHYGEAAAALACEMYDMTAEAAGMMLPSAEPADTATINEVGKAVNGSLKRSTVEIPSVVYRLSKQAAADTTLKNAKRDRAEFAWIPSGDTCAFCLALASRGWQEASRKTIKGDHAEHIHANCDCQFAIRFHEKDGVAGYNPDEYLEMYENADGRTSKDKINAMRREFYAQDKEDINEQKRIRYAARRAEESELYE